MKTRGPTRAVAFLLAALSSGCSVRLAVMNQLGNALASGGSAYASDDDPELVGAAVPFSLKLVESVLAETPRHQALLLSASSGFTQYAYAFVEQPADQVEGQDLARATAMRERARRLYLRARNYGLRGLEVGHPGFGQELRSQPRQALAAMTARDVPLLYWTAASWGGALSLGKQDPEIVADQPIVEALLDRVLALDEGFGKGAVRGLLISYEPARLGGGEPTMRARAHLERALELSGGRLAAPLVAFAESICVAKQDRAEFEALLARAITIDADAEPADRLANLVLQRRARWLIEHAGELFAK